MSASTFELADGGWSFTVLCDPKYIVNGHNDVQLFEINGPGLVPITIL